MHNVGIGLVVALALTAVVLVSGVQKPCSDTAARIAEATAKQIR
jgi:hypothetical protein